MQDKSAVDLHANTGVAMREFQTNEEPADYVLFVQQQPVGIIEAKREEAGTNITMVEEQSHRYLTPGMKYVSTDRLCFAYESTGQITRFTDYRNPHPRSREVFSFHRPETLLHWSKSSPALRAQLQRLPPLPAAGLRLPTGILHAQGVKANVLFFDNKPAAPHPWTKEVWIYDYRTNIHHTLKKRPLRFEYLQDFIDRYQAKNRSARTEEPEGRWRKFSYEKIIACDKTNLDIFWLRDESLTDLENPPERDVLAEEIIESPEAALEGFRSVVSELD